ncbi:MAG: EamA family transporter [Candidatus Neomarinimicrobiota bacterium]|nr:EamA family transporter [Candidatus Neomarinimicrobiota bacterium]
MNKKILFPFIALCLIWGSTWYFITVSVFEYELPPIYAVGIRFLPSGLLFLLIILLRGESIPINKESVKVYLSFSLLNFSLSYGITYNEISKGLESSISAVIWGLFPIITSIMAHFMIYHDPDERLTKNKLIALATGFIGLFIISFSGDMDKSLGIGFLIFAIFAAAYPSVLYKKNQKAVNHYQMNAVCQIITGVVMLSLSYLVGEETHNINWNQELIMATIYLIIMGGVISWGIYFWLYQHLTITQITYVAIFPPIVAIITGWIFLNEALTIKEIIGTILILSGSVLIYRK